MGEVPPRREPAAYLRQREGALCGAAEVAGGEFGYDPAAGRPLEEPELQQVRLDHVLDRVGLLPHRRRERREPDRTAAELVEQAEQDGEVELVEPLLVDLEQREPRAGYLVRDLTVVADLGDVANPSEEPVRHAGRPARAAGDLVGALQIDRHLEDPGRAADDRAELLRRVGLEPGGE